MGWTQEQQKAIDKRNSNILVAASAVSGKTAVLVERIIKRIIEENVDIDKLLIVTFTRAAAREMKERIENKIREKLREDSSNKHLRKQLKNIKNAYITTIDSFFFKVVQNNFYELSGIDPSVSIAETKDVFTIKNKIFNDLLEEEYEKDGNASFERVYNGICNESDEKFKELVYGLHTFSQGFPYPDEWLEKSAEIYNMEGVTDLYDTALGKDLYNKFMEDIEVAIENMKLAITYVEDDEQMSEKYVEQFEKDIKVLKMCRNIETPSFAKLYDIQKAKLFGRMPTVRGIENTELRDSVAAIRTRCKDLVEKEFSKIIYAPIDKIISDLNTSYEDAKYIVDLVTKFDQNYMKAKIKSNKLEFGDIAHLALNMLIKREKDENGNYTYIETNVAKKYKEKFDEIYIDEYQDSNYIQEYALRAVSKVSEGNPNQFMVGDIKQSIYKFRNAVPEIFATKYDEYLETEDANFSKIILAKNFRSRKEVLDGINYIFKQVMSKEAGECSYTGKEILSLGADYETLEDQDYKMELHVVNITDEEAEEMESGDELIAEVEELKGIKLEAEVIASRIKELMNKEKPFKVYNLKKKEFTNIKYKDIVILLRSAKGKDKVIEETLKESGIPCFADSSEGLLNTEEVKFVLTFLELLDNWYQDIPLTAMMYSIIGNFTLDEITVIRKTYKEGYMLDAVFAAREIENLVIREKVVAFLATLEKFTYYSKYYGISELIWKIYNETNVYEQFLLKENGPQKCANLDNLLNIAVSFEKVDYKGLYHFIEYVREIQDTDKSKEAKVIGENEDVVRIMTVHKSKGLEYPVVFLAGTNDNYIKTNKRPDVYRHMKYGIGLDVIESFDDYYTTLHPSILKSVILNSENDETISEELRCLYVALTRAKEKMIITGAINRKTDFEKKLENLVLLRDDKDCIKSNFVLKCKSNLDTILLALKEDILENKVPFTFKLVPKSASKFKIVKDEVKDNYFQTFENYVSTLEEKDISKFKEILEYEYPYKKSVNALVKYSVSEIKKMQLEEEQVLENIAVKEYDEVSVKVPKFMRKKEETKYSAAQKGTIMHLILNYLDYKTCSNLEDIKNLVESLIEKDIVTREETKYVSYKKILQLLESNIAKEAKKSVKIYKEKPFVYKINPKENKLVKDKIDTPDEILIQGIIDLYYIDENNEITLVDYKTDKVEKEEELVEKYKIQLLLYKEALENISNKKVKKVYIYSTTLGREIEI